MDNLGESNHLNEIIVDKLKNEDDQEKKGRGMPISAAVLLGLARRKIEASKIKINTSFIEESKNNLKEETKNDQIVNDKGNNLNIKENDNSLKMDEKLFVNKPNKRRHSSFSNNVNTTKADDLAKNDEKIEIMKVNRRRHSTFGHDINTLEADVLSIKNETIADIKVNKKKNATFVHHLNTAEAEDLFVKDETLANKKVIKRRKSTFDQDVRTKEADDLSVKDETLANIKVNKRRHSTFDKSSENDTEIFFLPFEKGWTRELVYRSNTDSNGKRNADVYYKSPDNVKLRSYPNIISYLEKSNITDLNIANFTFNKRTVYHPPGEIVRNAEARFSSNNSSIKSTPTSSPKSLKIVIPIKKNLNKCADNIKANLGSKIDTGKIIARQLAKSSESRRKQEELDLMKDVNEILQHTKPQLKTDESLNSQLAEIHDSKSCRPAKKQKFTSSNTIDDNLNVIDALLPNGVSKSNSLNKAVTPSKPMISIIMEKSAKRKAKRDKMLSSSIHELGEKDKSMSKTIESIDSIKVKDLIKKNDDDNEKINVSPSAKKLKVDSEQIDEKYTVASNVNDSSFIEKRKAARTAANLALRAYMDNALKSVEPVTKIVNSTSSPKINQILIKKTSKYATDDDLKKNTSRRSTNIGCSQSVKDIKDSALSPIIKKLKDLVNNSSDEKPNKGTYSALKRSKRISAIKQCKEYASNESECEVKIPNSTKKVRFSLDINHVNNGNEVKEILPIVIQPDFDDDEDEKSIGNREQLNASVNEILPSEDAPETANNLQIDPIIIEPLKTTLTIYTSTYQSKIPEIKKQSDARSCNQKSDPNVKKLAKPIFINALNSADKLLKKDKYHVSHSSEEVVITSVKRNKNSEIKKSSPRLDKINQNKNQKETDKLVKILPKPSNDNNFNNKQKDSQQSTILSDYLSQTKSKLPTKPQQSRSKLSKPDQLKPQEWPIENAICVNNDIRNQPNLQQSSKLPLLQQSKFAQLSEGQQPQSKSLKSDQFKNQVSLTNDQEALKYKICDMECPNLVGIAPNLYCDMCMAAFHHTCVGYNFLPSRASYTCWSCRSYSLNAENIEFPLHSYEIQVPKLADETNIYRNDLINLKKLEPIPKPKDPFIDEDVPRKNFTVSHAILSKIDINKPITLKTKERTVMVEPNNLSISRFGLNMYLGVDDIEEKYVGGHNHLLIFKVDTTEMGEQVLTVCSVEEQIEEMQP